MVMMEETIRVCMMGLELRMRRFRMESVAVEISRMDVKMDRRVSVFSLFFLHQSFCLSCIAYLSFCSLPCNPFSRLTFAIAHGK